MTIYQNARAAEAAGVRLGFLRGLEMVNDKQWETRSPVGAWREIVGGPSV